MLHYRLPRLLGHDAARAALQRWMAGNETVKDLDRKAHGIHLRARWFPVWMFRLSGPDGEVVRIEPAAPTPIPQLADLRIPAGELQPFAPIEGESETPVSVPIETARAWLAPSLENGHAELRETALVQLPLWECSYRYSDHAYSALVDGSTGAVLASVFPAKSEGPFLLTAGLGLALFSVLGIVISNPALKLLAYGVTAVPLLLLAYWVSRKV